MTTIVESALGEALHVRQVDMRSDSGFGAYAGQPAVQCQRASAEANEDARAILKDQMNPVIAALYECPKPTIAAVNGAAMGFGLGLALACDVVFASEAARFAVPFARLGAALDSGGHFLLLQRVTRGRALHMVYSAESLDGHRRPRGAARVG